MASYLCSDEVFAAVAALCDLMESTDVTGARVPPVWPMVLHGSTTDPTAHLDEHTHPDDVPGEHAAVYIDMARGSLCRVAVKGMALMRKLLQVGDAAAVLAIPLAMETLVANMQHPHCAEVQLAALDAIAAVRADDWSLIDELPGAADAVIACLGSPCDAVLESTVAFLAQSPHTNFLALPGVMLTLVGTLERAATMRETRPQLFDGTVLLAGGGGCDEVRVLSTSASMLPDVVQVVGALNQLLAHEDAQVLRAVLAAVRFLTRGRFRMDMHLVRLRRHDYLASSRHDTLADAKPLALWRRSAVAVLQQPGMLARITHHTQPSDDESLRECAFGALSSVARLDPAAAALVVRTGALVHCRSALCSRDTHCFCAACNLVEAACAASDETRQAVMDANLMPLVVHAAGDAYPLPEEDRTLYVVALVSMRGTAEQAAHLIDVGVVDVAVNELAQRVSQRDLSRLRALRLVAALDILLGLWGHHADAVADIMQANDADHALRWLAKHHGVHVARRAEELMRRADERANGSAAWRRTRRE